MKHRKAILIFLSAVLVFACNVPATVVVVTATPGTTTVTPTLPPAASATPFGSTVPFAAPNDGSLNCRTGPGTNYQVSVLLAGTQSAEIVGKNPESTWWYVKNPYTAGAYCWVISTFVNVTGDLSKIQIVGVPATPTNPTSTVIAVDMAINPDTVHVAGCVGPAQSITVTAKIQTNGPMTIRAHFRDEQSGDLAVHELNFTRADIQDISDTFTPKLKDGKYKIFLIIDGLDLSDLSSSKPYKITC